MKTNELHFSGMQESAKKMQKSAQECEKKGDRR
jgi:hypothetical protein